MNEKEPLFEIIDKLSPKLNLKEILQAVIDSAQEIILSEAGTLFLKDKERSRIIFQVVNGPFKDKLQGKSIPLTKGVVAKVINTGKSTIVNYPDKESKFYNKVDKKLGYRTRNMICTPLKIGNEIIGAIEMINKKNGEYTQKDIEKLEKFSARSALIINTGLMYQKLSNLTSALGKSEKFLSAIMENVPTGITILDKNGIILRVNKYFENVIGKKEDEVMGRSIWEAFPEIKNGLRLENKKRMLVHYGEKTFESKVVNISKSGETYILVNFRDLTDTMELQKLQSLEGMKKSFLAAVSHELRTPLTSIIGFSSMTMEPTLGENKRREYLNIIFKESNKLKELLETVIEVIKMSDLEAELKRERLDINMLVMEVMEEFRPLSHIHKFRTNIETDMPPVYIDAKWMKRAIYEIIENAVKYSPAGGRITVKIRKRNGNVIVSIQDEGIGIPEDRIPYILEPLERADDPLSGRGGLGLGLGIANMIVNAHKGKIEIKNRRKKGLMVNIIIPIE